jgi:hypothetical protein
MDARRAVAAATNEAFVTAFLAGHRPEVPLDFPTPVALGDRAATGKSLDDHSVGMQVMRPQN